MVPVSGHKEVLALLQQALQLPSPQRAKEIVVTAPQVRPL